MRKWCETCRFAHVNNGTNMDCASYRKSIGMEYVFCEGKDLSQWQPKEGKMEQRLKNIVARVRKIYPDKYVDVCLRVKHHKNSDVKTFYELYVEHFKATKEFASLQALSHYVEELEEKHRKENMTDVEKIREYVKDSETYAQCFRKRVLDFIDSLPKPEKPMVF